ncbi:hypothetical protein D6D17_06468 [Aureobasidium pullulans]|nr:hypothetical protein D6D17_06468 [Aureobasidium pullulans]
MRASGIESFVQLENSHLLKDTQRTVSIDPGRTLQILINLVGNAVKFLADREKKELHISLAASVTQSKLPGIRYAPSSPESNNSVGTFPEFPKEEEVYVHFSVKDTGPGLSEEQMDALFTRFRQSSPRTHAQYGGSGLGLFISRQLTELHGGHIGVASKLDQGSTFSFSLKGRKLAPAASNSNSNNLIPSQTLQMSNSETKAPPETQPERPEVSLVGHGVLIVEDNIINQQLLARQLRKHGMEVTCANHGEEALSILKSSTWWNGTSDDHSHESRRQYSIILCDLEMPVMDGKTCDQVHRSRDKEHSVELMTQEKEATRLHNAQRAVLEGLHSEEQQLQLVKTQAEDTGDIDDIEKAEDDLRDVSRARIAISQFATVSEYIAKSSIATRTNQDIGNITIADLGYGAVGICNVEEIDTVKQKIGDVSVGSGGTAFIGIHGKVDHNAALAGRWTSGNKS